MKIYPAIDLLDGKVVRLEKGEYSRSKVYYLDPIEILETFEKEGAQSVHIVDLNGSKDSKDRQSKLLRDLISQTRLSCQVGGGIRSIRDMSKILGFGASRVITGSFAMSDPSGFKAALKEFGGNRIVLAADSRPDAGGTYQIATAGWKTQSDKELKSFIREFVDDGLKSVLATDISRDGMLTGSNFELYRELSAEFPELEIIASGGLSGLNDVRMLKKMGIQSAILGKALYEKKLTLRGAIEC